MTKASTDKADGLIFRIPKPKPWVSSGGGLDWSLIFLFFKEVAGVASDKCTGFLVGSREDRQIDKPRYFG